MTKHEFIAELRTRLSEFPRQEVEERLDFYGEMIDDCECQKSSHKLNASQSSLIIV